MDATGCLTDNPDRSCLSEHSRLKSLRMKLPALAGLAIGLLVTLADRLPADEGSSLRPRPFEIQVLDADTGRGVPLVELETVHNVRYITDNAGRVAYDEPIRPGETIFFSIHAHGYEVPKDGFGIAGARLKIEAGGRAEVKLKRRNVAERLYRLTGQDLYRDSVLLGHDVPLQKPFGPGMVAGQDSTLAAEYRGKIYWFWGDTNRLSYPLGLFRTAGATTSLPGPELKPSVAIDYHYFTGDDGFARNMVEVEDPKGVVWIDGVTTVPDPAENGRERLVARFSRREGLSKALEQGMVVYNDDRELFEVRTTLPLSEEWRFLRDHPTPVQVDGEAFLASGNPFPVTRVKRSLDAVLDPKAYTSWSCAVEGESSPSKLMPRRKPDGSLDWRWQNGPPVTAKDEARWIEGRAIRPEEAYFLPEDVSRPGRRITPHTGTIQWNEHRQKWVLVVVELTMDKESPSMLGEMYYSEASEAHGPWRKAVKILSHDKQTFYNPVHHPFFDEDGGRTIYFEGTYCNTFTNSPATQRYNYNQMLYRLDLDDERLRAVRE